MPKPQGTYLRIQSRDKTAFVAAESKKNLSLSKQQDLSELEAALNQVAERDLNSWYRSMSALVDDIKNNEMLSKDEKVRNGVSKVAGEVRKFFENVKDLKQVEGRLQVPVYPVMRAPPELGAAGAELAFVIALCQVLEVLVRLKRKSS